MKSLICRLLLIAFATTSLAAPPSRPDNVSLAPICFEPPDREHHISEVANLCRALFTDFILTFGDRANSTLDWTGDNNKRRQPNTVHLPMIKGRKNEDKTQECFIEVIDLGSKIGDDYPPENVVDRSREILETCIEHDQCGEIPLPPLFLTGVAVCAGEMKKPSSASLTLPSTCLADDLGCSPDEPRIAPAQTENTAT